MADQKPVNNDVVQPTDRPSVEDLDEQHPGKMPSAFVRGAKNASDKEQAMTLMEGIRLYPKAIAWSLLISTCIVMEG